MVSWGSAQQPPSKAKSRNYPGGSPALFFFFCQWFCGFTCIYWELRVATSTPRVLSEAAGELDYSTGQKDTHNAHVCEAHLRSDLAAASLF